MEHQYTPDDFRPFASFLFTSKDRHHLNWYLTQRIFLISEENKEAFHDVSQWNVIGTRESVIQHVFRFNAFFCVTKSLGNIFGQKGKRIENTLGEGERLQRGGSRGRVYGVRTPPEMTCGFLIQLVFYKKNYVVYWC